MIKLEPNNYYHLYNRGNNREKLFYTEANYEYFIDKYQHHCHHVLDTFAYCLMGNHFHILASVRSLKEQEELFKQVNLRSDKLRSASKHLSNCFNSYTLSINKQENRTGSLFEKPFKRKKIESEEYFRRLIIYIHQNPVKHGFTHSIDDYFFSSHHLYYNDKPTFINREKTLELFGGIKKIKAAHLEANISDEEILFD